MLVSLGVACRPHRTLTVRTFAGLYRQGEGRLEHYLKYEHVCGGGSTSAGTWTLSAPIQPGCYIVRFVTHGSGYTRPAVIHSRAYATLAESNMVMVGILQAYSADSGQSGPCNSGDDTRLQLADSLTAGSYFDTPDVALGMGSQGFHADRSNTGLRSLSRSGDGREHGDAGPLFDDGDPAPTLARSSQQWSLSASRTAYEAASNEVAARSWGGDPALVGKLGWAEAEILEPYVSLDVSLRSTIDGVAERLMGRKRECLSGVYDARDLEKHLDTLSCSASTVSQRKSVVEFLLRALSTGGRQALMGRAGLPAQLLQLANECAHSDSSLVQILQILVSLGEEGSRCDAEGTRLQSGDAAIPRNGEPGQSKATASFEDNHPATFPVAREPDLAVTSATAAGPAPATDGASEQAGRGGEFEPADLVHISGFWSLVDVVRGSRNHLAILQLARLLCAMLRTGHESVASRLPQMLPILWRALEDVPHKKRSMARVLPLC